MKVQEESFHLNGHITGLRRQTQKLDSPYKTPSNTGSEGVEIKFERMSAVFGKLS